MSMKCSLIQPKKVNLLIDYMLSNFDLELATLHKISTTSPARRKKVDIEFTIC